MKSYLIPKNAGYLLYLTLFVILSCVQDDHRKNNGSDEAMISFSLNASGYSINEDDEFWEDRVDELRMLVFQSDDGEIVFNEQLYFPDGFSQKSKAVALPLGTFNFYFIANETVYPDDFTEALISISNESEFQTDTRFTTLDYNPDFLPDATSREGRFVMSAVYTDITVAEGGRPRPIRHYCLYPTAE